MAEPLLSLKNLRKAYGALTVTDDVSLDLVPGEVHALIGPNGAGKTTLIQTISGMLKPDAGKILFDGHDLTHKPAHLRARYGLARSFQITSLLPHFSALENVALAVQAHDGSSFRFFGRASAEKGLNDKAMAALEQVGMADRAMIAAGTLSHGEQRQLEIAVALALEPKLLLLDEPMAGAGPEDTARLTEILRKLKGRYTILLVEHDMQAVFALADCISVLVYGRVVASGSPEMIRNDPVVREAYLGEEAA